MITRSLVLSWHSDWRWGRDPEPEPDLFYRYYGLGWVSVGRSRLTVQQMAQTRKDGMSHWAENEIRKLQSKLRRMHDTVRGQ